MQPLGFGTVLKAALIAGLAAGLTVALFHWFATEPIVDRAIALEEQRQHDQGVHEEPVVSRRTQKAGLFLGYLLYGLTWALLFGSAYHVVQRQTPALGGASGRFGLALAAYWAVGLLPLLKYPANPPGVGDPDTITYRQQIYVAFLILSVIGVGSAAGLGSHLGRRLKTPWGRWLLGGLFAVGFGLLLCLVMPDNPDLVDMPAGLVTTFRILSVVGTTLFWAIFGFFFAMLPRTDPARARVNA